MNFRTHHFQFYSEKPSPRSGFRPLAANLIFGLSKATYRLPGPLCLQNFTDYPFLLGAAGSKPDNMIRLIFIPLALLATLVLSCEKELIDTIAPTVVFKNLDGTEILDNTIDLPLGAEAEFTILINDEANIRDIRYLIATNGSESTVIDQPGYLEQVESSATHKIMVADIPFTAQDYRVGDQVAIRVMVNDPFGNATVEGLTINITN